MPRATLDEVRTRFGRCVEQRKDPMLFASMIAEQVGICDENGNRFRRADGAPTLGDKPTRLPTDFPFDLLAEAMIGHDWQEVLGISRHQDTNFITEMRSRFGNRSLFREEPSAAMGPSVWGNVAAWSATIGGLYQANFLLGYQQAPFDLVDLFPVRPAVFWQGGERYIGILGPYEPAPAVGPGEEYPDMSMSALWVEPGPMRKYAGKTLVAKETAAIDISGGQMLAKAKTGGESLKFRENELVLDLITGQTNNWKLGMLTDAAATAYNTYGPTITNPKGTARTIPNDIVNPLNDIGAFQRSDEQMANLFHPVTDNPIDVMMDTCLLPTPLGDIAKWLLGMGSWQAWNQNQANPAQQAPGNFPNSSGDGKNPYQNVLKPVVSRWLHQRQTASTTQSDPNRSAGLGLTGAAVYRWYRLNPAEFACRRQMWPAASVDISPGDYVMATQGIIAAQAFDIAVQAQVLNPYAIQRNKSA